MSGNYAAEHAGALADLRRVNLPLTFTRRVAGTDHPDTGTSDPPTITTVSGYGLQKSGDPQRHIALELQLSTTLTFFFVPNTYGLRAYTPEFVMADDTVDHNSTTYTVRDVDPNPSPDGYVIAARIICVR
jgi:hypothetical protein